MAPGPSPEHAFATPIAPVEYSRVELPALTVLPSPSRGRVLSTTRRRRRPPRDGCDGTRHGIRRAGLGCRRATARQLQEGRTVLVNATAHAMHATPMRFASGRA